MWMTDLGVNQATLLFDLGATYALKGATIWNYNFGNPAEFQSTILRGVKDYQLFGSTDGVNFSEMFSGTLALGTGQPLAGQVASFTGDARFVRLDILNNYGQGTYAEASWNAGLSEVRFAGAVPEPMTWAMMVAGFGLTGAAMRRRAAVAA
ncbi:PEPxxWA-CTERM sorting domain-containing protein [Polymorphobacter fuscus]|uniref:PEPxxWA-CTERM sorting domain-containing protein n=2 Tax=Sandarakinorhabdus fusca TaxID=1439888 RepID=A0A7C9GMP7_9SPHN|nr:discoidin domain-containing protein [Polymorphobacter fuscus]MQT16172.1 PEPxxWA-CTERM sorting domain-containing protein [Polymorphobacter fuscus]